MRQDDPRIEKALREEFGLERLRPRQAEAIEAVLAGRDVLLTMPTGAGKSLVYQLPAVVLPGLTLVVSPLIALMKDQVDALRKKGIRASFVNSSISGAERERRLLAAERGELDLLYVTPERFRSPRFLESIPRLQVERLAVDEAHCISQWGHDFRPDYSRLGEYRGLLGTPPTIALTATATPAVADDIVLRLGLQDPFISRAGIERENLFFSVSRVYTREEKEELLVQRLRAIGGAGIVYTALIRELEHLHGELARAGLRTLVYHGGLSDRERRQMQEEFLESEDAVVLATNAFGMGVDKPDVRFVIHAQVPRTLEAWSQEVGRAGRDGKPAWCELLYLEEDVAVQQGFVRWANPNLEYIVGVFETLRGWGERIQVKELADLRAELLVKERHDRRLEIALKWLEVLGVTKGSFEGRDLEIARPLDPAELPEFVGTEDKLKGDLGGLLAMVRFATSEGTARRQLLAEHFGLEVDESLEFGCDHTADAQAHLSKHFTPRQPGSGGQRTAGGERASSQASAQSSPDESPEDRDDGVGFRRGDWVRIDGRHFGQVIRVEGRGGRVKLVVESAGDLRRRTVDPRKQRVEHLDD